MLFFWRGWLKHHIRRESGVSGEFTIYSLTILTMGFGNYRIGFTLTLQSCDFQYHIEEVHYQFRDRRILVSGEALRIPITLISQSYLNSDWSGMACSSWLTPRVWSSYDDSNLCRVFLNSSYIYIAKYLRAVCGFSFPHYSFQLAVFGTIRVADCFGSDICRYTRFDDEIAPLHCGGFQ